MDCLTNLRANLRRIRLAKELTQQGVADLAGVDYKYLQNIEAGRWPNLTLATLQKLADALDVKAWELLCDVPKGKSKLPTRSRGRKSTALRRLP